MENDYGNGYDNVEGHEGEQIANDVVNETQQGAQNINNFFNRGRQDKKGSKENTTPEDQQPKDPENPDEKPIDTNKNDSNISDNDSLALGNNPRRKENENSNFPKKNNLNDKKTNAGENSGLGRNKNKPSGESQSNNPALGIGKGKNANAGQKTAKKGADAGKETAKKAKQGAKKAKKSGEKAAKSKQKIETIKTLLKNPKAWLVIIIILLVLVVLLLLAIIIFAYISVDPYRGDPLESGSSGSASMLCNTGNTSGSLSTFINGWEGSGPTCTTSNGESGYQAYDSNDGQITIGHGVTIGYVIRADYTKSYIDANNFGGHFRVDDNGSYYLEVGDCVSTEVIDSIQENSLNVNYGARVDEAIAAAGLELIQFQRDALVSFGYNTGVGNVGRLIEAYKQDSYEGLWSAMKDWVRSGDQVLMGLKKRRKGEFALFVTGDYSDNQLFYSRVIDDETYDNYDSEGVMARMADCETSEEFLQDQTTGFYIRNAKPANDNEFFYIQDANNYGNSDYEGECAFYGNNRAREILYYAGTPTNIYSAPNGGEYCNPSISQWATNYTVSYDINTPKQGSIISWTNWGYNESGAQVTLPGHVAIVEQVYEDGSILISEMFVSLGKFGTNAANQIDLYENVREGRKVNCRSDGASGCFQTRIISSDQIYSSGWGGNYAFKCYIYLLEN